MLKIVYKPLAKLIPYAKNSRTHSESQIKQIAASIKEFGWTNPILIDEEDVIIAGHGRVLAGELLGEKKAPTVTLAGLTDIQKQAYVIADNKLALNAGWDLEMLSLELKELNLADFQLDLIGFNDKELEDMLGMGAGSGGLTDPDAVPEIPEDPVSVLGDVWILGDHRLVCGDCTDPLVVDKCLNGTKPHLMVTDPPYGVKYDADWRNKAMRDNGKKIGARAVGKVENDNNADWSDAWSLFPGNIAYVWHAGKFASIVQKSLEDNKFEIRSQIIWAKTRFAISRGDYHWQHEPCWYAVKGKGNWKGDRSQTTLWNIDHSKSETGHSTQKPVECMRRPIVNNSSPGQIVYDPFNGSGTTIIAAEGEGRHCYAIEINPAYVDVTINRWQQFTGEQAILEGTNTTFEEISHGRQKA